MTKRLLTIVGVLASITMGHAQNFKGRGRRRKNGRKSEVAVDANGKPVKH